MTEIMDFSPFISTPNVEIIDEKEYTYLKIGIIGSRRRNSIRDFYILLERLLEFKPAVVVTGDCEDGWDFFARLICQVTSDHIQLIVKERIDPETGEKLERYVSDYYEYCKINYARNIEIAKENLDYLLAAVAPDRTGGTEHTIKMFKAYHQDWRSKLVIC